MSAGRDCWEQPNYSRDSCYHHWKPSRVAGILAMVSVSSIYLPLTISRLSTVSTPPYFIYSFHIKSARPAPNWSPRPAPWMDRHRRPFQSGFSGSMCQDFRRPRVTTICRSFNENHLGHHPPTPPHIYFCGAAIDMCHSGHFYILFWRKSRKKTGKMG